MSDDYHSVSSKRGRDVGVESSRRRKLRKGTRSCWECRRRKIACVVPPRDDICTHCNNHGLKCVGQELPDTGRVLQSDDRITRLETLVGKVLDRLDRGHFPDSEPREKVIEGRKVSENPVGNVEETESRHGAHPKVNEDSPDESGQASRGLLSLLPDDRDLNIILSMPFDIPGSITSLPCVQKCIPERGQSPTLKALLQLPKLDDPLISIAKTILMLSSVLQSMPQRSIEYLDQHGVDYLNIEQRGMKAVQRLVLCHDNLVQTVDGVECLCIEAMYWNAGGELRKAWLGTRRAMTIAQLLGIQSCDNSMHGGRTAAGQLWFFLMCSDRYLSLTLGLPRGVLDSNNLADIDTLAASNPVQRMQRLHCLASGQLLQQKELSKNDQITLGDIDRILQHAAECMSPQWWAFPPTLESQHDKVYPGVVQKRLMDQMVHFNLVARLHLPFLLSTSDDGKLDGYRFVCTNASRSVLTRYLAFRDLTTTGNYCRGIDFLMFTAVITLSVAHIEAYHRKQNKLSHSVSYLDHERFGDRGLMSRVLEKMEQTVRKSGDKISTTMAKAIGHLVKCEAEASNGKLFAISTLEDHDAASNITGELNEARNRLSVAIPWIGIIRIEQQTVSDNDWAINPPGLEMSFFEDDMSLQGVDTALFEDMFRGFDLDLPQL